MLLFGTMADKPFARMLARLAPLASHRVFATPGGRAPAPVAELAAAAPGEAVGAPAAAFERAVELARGASAGGRPRIVVTGSLYLVGELRSRLLGLDCDPIVPL